MNLELSSPLVHLIISITLNLELNVSLVHVIISISVNVELSSSLVHLIISISVNGDRVWMSMHHKTHSEITKWMEVLRTQQGDVSGVRLRKYQYTDNPSVQGPWTPFTHKDPELNLAQLPDPKFGANNRLPMTATEKLRLMFEKQKISENDVKTGE